MVAMIANQPQNVPAYQSQLMTHAGATKVTRDQLAVLTVPEATRTHKPVAHIDIVNHLIESLSYRHISVVGDEYAVSEDGMKMFGVMDLFIEGSQEMEDLRFSIGLRNSNDKTMRLALTAGFRVFVCDNLAFSGDYTPVLHKHSAKFDLTDALAIGVEKIQRNFTPLRNQINSWKSTQISAQTAKAILYDAFIGEQLNAPKTLIKDVAELYFNPKYPEFSSRTLWSLHNAFTSAFKSLAPIKQFESTASLGKFFQF